MFFKKSLKQIIALFTMVILLVGSIPYSANAQKTTQRVYTNEGCEIIYSVTSR